MNLKWMNKLYLLALILITILKINVIANNIYDSEYIINNSKQLNGQTILYEGEAVGDIMIRKNDFGWINVNDGKSAIGIWANKEELDKIQYLGEYKVKGDTILITGTVNNACKQHGGDLDIHAEKIEIIESGRTIEDIPNQRLLLILRALLLPTGIILAIVLIENSKKKKNIE